MPKPKPFTMMIAGKRWRIEWSPPRGHFGYYRFPDRIIDIDPGLRKLPDSLRNVLYHEVDHAITCEFDEEIAEASAAAHSEAQKKLAKYLDAPEDAA